MNPLPCFVVYFRSGQEAGWQAVPSRIEQRWRSEEQNLENLVHFQAMSDDLPAKLIPQMAKAVNLPQGARPGFSILLVWDCIDGQSLTTCLENTATFLNALQALVEANKATYPQLTNKRIEAILRLPLVQQIAGDQKSTAPDISILRSSINRVWIVAGSNIDPESHKAGVTVTNEQESDSLLAEIIIHRIAANIDEPFMRRLNVGQTWSFASIGTARVSLPGKPLQQYCAGQYARRLLTGMLAEAKLPSKEAVRDGLEKDLSLVANTAGLGCDTILNLLLHPDTVTGRELLADVPDLVQWAGEKSRPRLSYDMESISMEQTWSTPREVMVQAEMKMAETLFHIQFAVRQARMWLFQETAHRLKTKLAETAGQESHHAQLHHRVQIWRDWFLNEEKKSVDAVNAKVTLDAMTDPINRYKKLFELLEHRPLASALVSRSLVGGLLGGQTLALFLGLHPDIVNLPVITSPWLVAGAIPLLWLGASAWYLLRQKKKRQDALNDLLNSISSKTQYLLKDFLIQELKSFYLDLAAFAGEREDQAEDNPRLKALREEIQADPRRNDEEKERLLTLLNLTLLERLQIYKETLSTSLESIPVTMEASMQANPWLILIPAPDDAVSFPFKAEDKEIHWNSGTGSIDQEILSFLKDEGKSVSAIFEACERSREQSQKDLAGLISQWCANTGFKYIRSLTLPEALKYIEKDGKTVDWLTPVKRASNPYFKLNSPTWGARITKPPFEFPGMHALFAEDISTTWIGSEGIVACRIQGPVSEEQVKGVPLLSAALSKNKKDTLPAEMKD